MLSQNQAGHLMVLSQTRPGHPRDLRPELQGWPKKPNPKNPTQKTRKKPTAKNPSYLGFLGFMGFLKKMADFRMNIKNK